MVFTVGVTLFGLMLGFVLGKFIRRTSEKNYTAGNFSGFLSAILGTAVIQLVGQDKDSTGWYLIGLSIGFFLHLLVVLVRTHQIFVEEKDILHESTKGSGGNRSVVREVRKDYEKQLKQSRDKRDEAIGTLLDPVDPGTDQSEKPTTG